MGSIQTTQIARKIQSPSAEEDAYVDPRSTTYPLAGRQQSDKEPFFPVIRVDTCASGDLKSPIKYAIYGQHPPNRPPPPISYESLQIGINRINANLIVNYEDNPGQAPSGTSTWAEFGNGTLLVADHLVKLTPENEVAGYCTIRPLARDVNQLSYLAVNPAFRRRGIARELLSCAAQDASTLSLLVRQSNASAQRFYASLNTCGFSTMCTPHRPGVLNFRIKSDPVSLASNDVLTGWMPAEGSWVSYQPS